MANQVHRNESTERLHAVREEMGPVESLPSVSLADKPSSLSRRDGAINEEDEDDEANKSLDREIMQDLDNYRREEEIKRLKDRTEEAGSDSESDHLSISPSSPRLRGYLDSTAIEGVGAKNSGTHSQDSLRKQNKADSPVERLGKDMGLFEVNNGQNLGMSNENNEIKHKKKDKKGEKPGKKKHKRHMQERIANILVDIDKSIYEINRNKGDQGIVNRLSKKNSYNLKAKSSKNVF